MGDALPGPGVGDDPVGDGKLALSIPDAPLERRDRTDIEAREKAGLQPSVRREERRAQKLDRVIALGRTFPESA